MGWVGLGGWMDRWTDGQMYGREDGQMTDR